MIPFFERTKDPKWIVGILISLIVLAMGIFLYMRTEGDDRSGLDEVSDQAVSTSSPPSVVEVAVKGDSMVTAEGQNEKPFIMAIIPGDLVLQDGAYRAKSGEAIRVRVRAINVVNGVLYFKPKSSTQTQVQESEKIADLSASDLPGEFEASFIPQKDTEGLLVAVMKGKGGQEAQVSVNVAAEKR